MAEKNVNPYPMAAVATAKVSPRANAAAAGGRFEKKAPLSVCNTLLSDVIIFYS
jgi:hypothetical protein